MKRININRIYYIFCYLIAFITFNSCSKSDLLDAKPRTNLAVPNSIADYQALLEKDGILGVFGMTPALGELSQDNYFIPDARYPAITTLRDRTAYVWATDIFQGQGNQPDWNIPYSQILNTNIAIEGVSQIPVTSNNQSDWNIAMSDALFLRAYAYWNLAQVFTPVYDSVSANSDLGLPLKLASDVNMIVQRATVKQTYDQIIRDLQTAARLAPNSFAGHLNRASKPSVFGMMARVYQSMRSYSNAYLYADSALQLYNQLIDFNTASTTSTQPFAITNVETMYQSFAMNSSFSSGTTTAMVDTIFYKTFTSTDLRTSIYFRTPTTSGIGFKYGYEGPSTSLPFSGLAVDEMYLIRAECNARSGNLNAAVVDLNTLLIKRWKTGTFVPFVASTQNATLNLILNERRKELAFRGCLRWMDIRRLNKEGYNIILQRKVNGQVYTLQPNSPLFTLPIPPDEIALSGIQQNIR